MDVFDLVAKLTLDSSEYDEGLKNSEQSASSFGKIFKGAVAGVSGVVGVTTTVLTAMGTATAGATKAVVDGANEVSAYGDNIDKMSQKMGISAQAYQEWDAVMQHSGSSIEGLKMGFKTMNKQLADATEYINEITLAEIDLENQLENGEISLDEYNAKYDELYAGSNKSIEAFEKLGFTMDDISKMMDSPEEAFSNIISALQEMPEGTERTAIATELLGRSAMELGPLLNTSAEETQAMKDRVHELGGVLSDDAVKASANFQDNLQDMQTAMAGVKRGIMADLLPGLSSLMDGFTRLISGESGADEMLDSGIDKLLTGIESAGDKVLNIIVEVFPRIINGIATKFPELVTAIVGMISTIAPISLTAFSDNVIPALLGALPPILETLFAVIPPFFFSVIEQVLTFLPQILELAFTLILTLADGIADAIPTLIPIILTVLTTLVNVILKNLPMVLDVATKIIVAILEGILGNLDQISLAGLEIIYRLSFTLLSLIPQIIGVAFQIIYALVSSMAEGILKMLTADYWKKALDAIVHSFTDIDWAGIGMKVLEGIADGFTKGLSKVVDGAKNVANSIKSVFTGEMEIHSPSRVFERYGEMIDEGLAIGVGSGLSINATKNVAEDMNSSFGNSISGAGKGGDFIFPIYIGEELIETQVVKAIDVANYRSGGR